MGTQADKEEADEHKHKHLSCQTSTWANMHIHTDTGGHQQLNLEQIRQGGEVKRGQSLVFIWCVCSVQQASSPWRTHIDAKTLCRENKSSRLFQTYKSGFLGVNGELNGLFTRWAVAHFTEREINLQDWNFAAPYFNLCQHMKQILTNTLVEGYSEEGWCETRPQTEPDCCHEYNSVWGGGGAKGHTM